MKRETMKYILRILEDTHNSEPIDDLQIRVKNNKVYMQIAGENREIAVSRDDLRAVIFATEGGPP